LRTPSLFFATQSQRSFRSRASEKYCGKELQAGFPEAPQQSRGCLAEQM
jgi:hypothetical protein